MLSFETPQQTDARIAAARSAAQSEADAAASAVESALERLCWSEFEAAKNAKETVQQQMLDNLRQRKGEYTVQERAFIDQEGGTDIFMPLTQEKVAAAVAWLEDIYALGTGERPFKMKPTPVVDLPKELKAVIEAEGQQAFQERVMAGVIPPEAMREYIDDLKARTLQEAKQWAIRCAEHNGDKVDDVLRQGGFYESLSRAFDDGMGNKAGILKALVVRRRQRLAWDASGRKARLDNSPMRCFDSVSPFDIYPAPGIGTFQAGHVTERMRLTVQEFSALKGVPGFKDERITTAILQYGTDGYQNWWWSDTERADLEQRHLGHLVTPKGMYDVLEHWTYATGKMLREFGVPADEGLVEDQVYSIVAWFLGSKWLIGARINPFPTGERPYFKFGFRAVNGAFWYDSVCEVMRAIQRMANAAIRCLVNNMAQSAGPIEEIQTDRLAEGEAVKGVHPYQVIQTIAPKGGSAGPAVYLHQISINAGVYMSVYDWASRLCDAMLGLPSFLSGVSPTGAGTTSSGLAQLREMATRTFKFTVRSIDQAIAGVVKMTHVDIVLTDGEQDPSLLGDLQAYAIGSQAFADDHGNKVRMNELIQSTANPVDMQVMGPEGRAELMRAAFKDFDNIDLDKAIPSREALLLRAKQAMAAQMGVDMQGNPLPGAAPPTAPATVMPDGSTPADRGPMQ